MIRAINNQHDFFEKEYAGWVKGNCIQQSAIARMENDTKNTF